MFYKIVGVGDQCPDKPVVYTGEFVAAEGNHPLLLALAEEFGEREGECATARLLGWTGGDVMVWEQELGKWATRGEFSVDDTTFYVEVGESSFEGVGRELSEEVRAGLVEHALRETVKDKMVLAGLRCLWLGLVSGKVSQVEAFGTADEVRDVYVWFGGTEAELLALPPF